jgi:hypothetical protein
MGTSLTDVNDMFLTMVKDYKLDKLYNSNVLNFNTRLEGFLIQAIDEFEDICTQSLIYDIATQEFSETLTTRHKIILAKIMKKCWFTQEVNDTMDMKNFIQDHDFKIYSPAENLKEKNNLLKGMEEEISQVLLDYEYANNDWGNWRNQLFDE